MFFTWMIAANAWMRDDPLADPFRMAEEAAVEILHLPLAKRPETPLPNDKKLVA